MRVEEEEEMRRLEEVLGQLHPCSTLLHNNLLLSLGGDGVPREFHVSSGWSREQVVVVCVDRQAADISQVSVFVHPAAPPGLGQLLGPWVDGRGLARLVQVAATPATIATLAPLLGRREVLRCRCKEFYLGLEQEEEGEEEPGSPWRLAPLGPEHLAMVLASWKFAEVGGAGVMGAMVEGLLARASVLGVFARAGAEPLAWLALYPDGSLGMLHVREGWRRRGLASRLVRAMAARVRRQWGIASIIQIDDIDNTVPLALFAKLGFTFSQDFVYSNYVPH